MSTKYNYMCMSTIEILLLYHTLIQLCILNTINCTMILKLFVLSQLIV